MASEAFHIKLLGPRSSELAREFSRSSDGLTDSLTVDETRIAVDLERDREVENVESWMLQFYT